MATPASEPRADPSAELDAAVGDAHDLRLIDTALARTPRQRLNGLRAASRLYTARAVPSPPARHEPAAHEQAAHEPAAP